MLVPFAVGGLEPASRHGRTAGFVALGGVVAVLLMAAVVRGSARQIVLVNRTRKTAEAVATDLRYGIPLGHKVEITDAA